MVGRKNSLLVTKRSLRNAETGSGKRPRRTVQPKLLDDTVGMSRQEEQELNKALYASLHDSRRSKSLPSLTSLEIQAASSYYSSHSSNGNSTNGSSSTISGVNGSSSSSTRSASAAPKRSPPSPGVLTLGMRRAARTGNPLPKRFFRRSDSATHRSRSSTHTDSSPKKMSKESLALDESSQDSTRSSSSSVNGSKKKIHAQRKFAQGCSLPGTPTSLPTKTNTPPIKLLSHAPKTEDFLTFLCLRGSSALPPHLDFFNFSREELPMRSESSQPDLCRSRGKRPREAIPDENSSTSSGANDEIVEAAVATPSMTNKNLNSQSRRSAARASAGTPETARGIVSLRQGLQRKVSSTSSSSSSSPHLCVSSPSRTLPDTSITNTPPCLYKPKFYFIPQKASPSEGSGVLPGEFTPPKKAQHMSKHSPLIYRPSPSDLGLRGSSSRTSISSPSSSSSPSSARSSQSGASKRKQASTFFSSHPSGQVTECWPAFSPCFAVHKHIRLEQQQASPLSSSSFSSSFSSSISPTSPPSLSTPSSLSQCSNSSSFSPSSSSLSHSLFPSSHILLPSSPESSCSIHLDSSCLCSNDESLPSASSSYHFQDTHACHSESSISPETSSSQDGFLKNSSTCHQTRHSHSHAHSHFDSGESELGFIQSCHTLSSSSQPPISLAHAIDSYLAKDNHHHIDSSIPHENPYVGEPLYPYYSPIRRKPCHSSCSTPQITPSSSSSSSSSSSFSRTLPSTSALHGCNQPVLSLHANCLCWKLDSSIYPSNNCMNFNPNTNTNHNTCNQSHHSVRTGAFHSTGDSSGYDHKMCTDHKGYIGVYFQNENEEEDSSYVGNDFEDNDCGTPGQIRLSLMAGENYTDESWDNEDDEKSTSDDISVMSLEESEATEDHYLNSPTSTNFNQHGSCECQNKHRESMPKDGKEDREVWKSLKGKYKDDKHPCLWESKSKEIIPKLRIKLLKGNRAIIKKSRKSKRNKEHRKQNDFQNEFIRMLGTDETHSRSVPNYPVRNQPIENKIPSVTLAGNMYHHQDNLEKEMLLRRELHQHRKHLSEQGKTKSYGSTHNGMDSSISKIKRAFDYQRGDKPRSLAKKAVPLRKLAVKNQFMLTALNPFLESENEFSSHNDSDGTFARSGEYEENFPRGSVKARQSLFKYDSQDSDFPVTSDSEVDSENAMYPNRRPSLFQTNEIAATNHAQNSSIPITSGFWNSGGEVNNQLMHQPTGASLSNYENNILEVVNEKTQPLLQSALPDIGPSGQESIARPSVLSQLANRSKDKEDDKCERNEVVNERETEATIPAVFQDSSKPEESEGDIEISQSTKSSQDVEKISPVLDREKKQMVRENQTGRNDSNETSTDSGCPCHGDYQWINKVNIQVSSGQSMPESPLNANVPSLSVTSSMYHGRGKSVVAGFNDKCPFSLPSSPSLTINLSLPNTNACNDPSKTPHLSVLAVKDDKRKDSMTSPMISKQFKDSSSSTEGDKIEVINDPVDICYKGLTSEKRQENVCNDLKDSKRVNENEQIKGKEIENDEPCDPLFSNPKNVEDQLPNQLTDSFTQTECLPSTESEVSVDDDLKMFPDTKNDQRDIYPGKHLWRKNFCPSPKKEMVCYVKQSYKDEECSFNKTNVQKYNISMLTKVNTIVIEDDDGKHDDNSSSDDLEILEDDKKVPIEVDLTVETEFQETSQDGMALDLSVHSASSCTESLEECFKYSSTSTQSNGDDSDTSPPKSLGAQSDVSVKGIKLFNDNTLSPQDDARGPASISNLLLPFGQNGFSHDLSTSAVYPVSLTKVVNNGVNNVIYHAQRSQDCNASTTSYALQTEPQLENRTASIMCNSNQNSEISLSIKQMKKPSALEKKCSIDKVPSMTGIHSRNTYVPVSYISTDMREARAPPISEITLHSFGSLCTGQGYTFISGKPRECEILNMDSDTLQPQTSKQNLSKEPSLMEPQTNSVSLNNVQKPNSSSLDSDLSRIVNNDDDKIYVNTGACLVPLSEAQLLSSVDGTIDGGSKSFTRQSSEKGNTLGNIRYKDLKTSNCVLASQPLSSVSRNANCANKNAQLSENIYKLKNIGRKGYDSGQLSYPNLPTLIPLQRTSIDDSLVRDSLRRKDHFFSASNNDCLRQESTLNQSASSQRKFPCESDSQPVVSQMPRTIFEQAHAFAQATGVYPNLRMHPLTQNNQSQPVLDIWKQIDTKITNLPTSSCSQYGQSAYLANHLPSRHIENSNKSCGGTSKANLYPVHIAAAGTSQSSSNSDPIVSNVLSMDKSKGSQALSRRAKNRNHNPKQGVLKTNTQTSSDRKESNRNTASHRVERTMPSRQSQLHISRNEMSQPVTRDFALGSSIAISQSQRPVNLSMNKGSNIPQVRPDNALLDLTLSRTDDSSHPYTSNTVAVKGTNSSIQTTTGVSQLEDTHLMDISSNLGLTNLAGLNQNSLLPSTLFTETDMSAALSGLDPLVNSDILNSYKPSSDLSCVEEGDDANILDVIMEELKEQIHLLREEIKRDSMPTSLSG